MAKLKEKIVGTCNICGKYGELTFEHIPPKSAFNTRPVVSQHIWELMKKSDLDDLSKGPIQQRGMGAYTLCGRCNNNTGRWYGNAFADWAIQGMEILLPLVRNNSSSTLYHIFHLLPLRVIKQILCMLFSVNGKIFRETQPELEKFILNKHQKYLPPDINVYTFYNISSRMRASGVRSRIDGILSHSHQHCFSEITFPPFGYIVSFDSPPPQDNLCPITHFADYDFDEDSDITLRMPILPIYSFMPADFRSREEIKKVKE
jgi:hypothetical protein